MYISACTIRLALAACACITKSGQGMFMLISFLFVVRIIRQTNMCLVYMALTC